MGQPHTKTSMKCGETVEKVVENLSSKPAFYSIDLSSLGKMQATRGDKG